MLNRLMSALRGLAGRRSAERELDEELRYHVEMEVEANIARGLSPREARRLALRDLGGVQQTREAVRAERATWLDALACDLRYATRSLAKAPALSVTIIATLAVGIGGGTIVFGVVDALLLRPLPYRQPDRLAVVTPSVVRWADYETIRLENRSFSDVAAYAQRGANLVIDGKAERGIIAAVSPNFLSVLGAAPRIGRAFVPADSRSGADQVALLSDAFWRGRFASSSSALGRTILIDRRVFTVVGVLPPDFKTPREFEAGRDSAFDRATAVFVPVSSANGPDNRSVTGVWFGTFVIGRLKDAVTWAHARSDVEPLATRELLSSLPRLSAGRAPSLNLQPLRQALTGDFSSRLVVLSLAGVLLVLAACGNVANLMLERVERRRSELALRAALGASASQLLRSVLTEGLLLALAGGTTASLVAWAGVRLIQVYGGAVLPCLSDVRVDPRTLMFACTLSLATTALIGLALAFRLFRLGIGRSIHTQVVEPRIPGRMPVSSLLVVTQMATSSVLIVVGALLARDLAGLASVELGFKPEGVLAAEVALDRVGYWGPAGPRFFSDLLDRLGGAPGVALAAVSTCPPGSGWLCGSAVQAENSSRENVEGNRVSENYFAVLSVPVLAGRTFTRDDSMGRHPLRLVVNEAFTRAHWASPQDAVGKRLLFPNSMGDPVSGGEIVGVVGNSREIGAGTALQPRVYTSFRQAFTSEGMTVLIKARGSVGALAGTLAAEVRRLDPEQPLFNVLTLDRIVTARYAAQRLMLVMMGAFATLTLLLAAVGIHGVIAYSMAMRRREIGIRRAFGATAGTVVGLFVLRALRLIALGLAVGLPIALAVRWFAVVEWVGSAGSEWMTCLAGVAAVALVGAVAAFIPAWRAVRLETVDVLRCE